MTVRVGVVGTSWYADLMHLPNLKSHPGAHVVAICGRTEARLADAVDRGTTVVAFSLVQSATGEIADLDAVMHAARAHDALVVVDATQACGWLPVTAAAVDALACGAYKWLMSPRGSAFLAVSHRLRDRLRPLHAGAGTPVRSCTAPTTDCHCA